MPFGFQLFFHWKITLRNLPDPKLPDCKLPDCQPDAICWPGLSLDANDLLKEMDDHKPMAQCIFDGGASIEDSWKVAVGRTRRDPRTKQRHPSDSLNALLIRNVCYKGSSSIVEQIFGKSRWLLGNQRLGGSDEDEFDAMKVVVDRRKEEEEAVIKLAQTLWGRHYGVARTTGAVRAHLGSKRKSKPSGIDIE